MTFQGIGQESGCEIAWKVVPMVFGATTLMEVMTTSQLFAWPTSTETVGKLSSMRLSEKWKAISVEVEDWFLATC